MNPKIVNTRVKKLLAIIVILLFVLFSCKQAIISDNFYLLKYRFDEISNLSLDTVYMELDTVFLKYTDHSGYYDPYSIDEQFLYLIMINEDCLQNKIIAHTIKVEGNSDIEPAVIEGYCSYGQICSTPAYKAYTNSSFYRHVLQSLYSSKYYPYHFLRLNWNYGYELSFIKDRKRFYNDSRSYDNSESKIIKP